MNTKVDFEWDDSLLLHYDIIDNQHKAIFKAFNVLIEGCNKDADRTKRGEHISECLDFLIQYVETHFEHEEALMEKNNYPHLESHKKEHRKFTKTVYRLKEDFKDYKNRSSFHAEFITEMMAWLKLHIKVLDKQFVTFVRENES